MLKAFPAHIRREYINEIEVKFVIQTVAEHCRNTAKYSGYNLKAVGLEKTAYLAGLLHDLGKSTNAYCKYINDAVVEEKAVRRGSVNHTFAGVHYVLSKRKAGDEIRNFAIEIIAYAIGAHHCLFDCIKDDGQNAFLYRMKKEGIHYEEAVKNYFHECATEEEIENLLQQAVIEITEIVYKVTHIESSKEKKDEMSFYYGLLCRLVTSAVIDGDRKDTAEFEQNKIIERENTDFMETLEKFNSFILDLKNSSALYNARKEISEACVKAGKMSEGLYRLNVPTGAGKTLSSLRYALEHSQKYNKQRIFIVMPLLGIIEQNAKEIRKAVQNDSIVLEHHSNIISSADDNAEELDKKELLMQSWDAPIIITTLVQMLNTMFSGKISSVRRFSALCNSVIIFDEVQSVPNRMLTLYNLTINFLVKICKATVVLCSATQPCFEKADHKLLPEISNLINLSQKTLNVFKRVKLVNRGAITMEELTNFAVEIASSEKSLLVICNTKGEAGELFINLQSVEDLHIPIYHLSGSMCTIHRKNVVEAMKNDLQHGKRIMCIATQVIEAGVDISFDSVIRLQAGMNNAIQAAGRCNRNYENNALELVYIVKLIGEKLNRLDEIEKAKIATDSLLQVVKYDATYGELMSDAAIAYYYERLFGAMDKGYQDFMIADLGKSLYSLLSSTSEIIEKDGVNNYILAQKFKTAGKYFHVLEDDTVELLVPYDNGRNIIAELSFEHDIRYAAEKIKKLTGCTVSIYKYQLDFLERNNAIKYDADLGVYVLANYSFYDEKIGLNLNANKDSDFVI